MEAAGERCCYASSFYWRAVSDVPSRMLLCPLEVMGKDCKEYLHIIWPSWDRFANLCLILHLLYFGVVLVSMAIAALYPRLQADALARTERQLQASLYWNLAFLSLWRRHTKSSIGIHRIYKVSRFYSTYFEDVSTKDTRITIWKAQLVGLRAERYQTTAVTTTRMTSSRASNWIDFLYKKKKKLVSYILFSSFARRDILLTGPSSSANAPLSLR